MRMLSPLFYSVIHFQCKQAVLEEKNHSRVDVCYYYNVYTDIHVHTCSRILQQTATNCLQQHCSNLSVNVNCMI